MKRLVEFNLEDGSSVCMEVDDPEQSGPIKSAGKDIKESIAVEMVFEVFREVDASSENRPGARSQVQHQDGIVPVDVCGLRSVVEDLVEVDERSQIRLFSRGEGNQFFCSTDFYVADEVAHELFYEVSPYAAHLRGSAGG